MLQRRWVHVPEESASGEMMFRPAGTPLPPARGRLALELREGGVLSEHRVGEADVPTEAEGSWRLEGDELVLERPGRGATRLRIRALEASRLIVDA